MSWRDAILVKCVKCKKLMGWHKQCGDAVCIDCELEGLIKQEQECWT